MATIGALLGAGIFGSGEAFGRKPEVPNLPAINPNAVQAETIAANQQSLPGLQTLATGINQFNASQQLGMLSQALNFLAPGQLQQAQANTTSLLAGQIPADVAAQIQRSSAAQSAAGGYGGGSGIGQNLTARDLGLTSLQLQQQGMQNFGALASMAPKTPLFDMSSMFYTPQQRLEFAFRDRESHWNAQWNQAQVKAAPDPFAAAMTQAFMTDEQAIVEMVGGVAGMAGCWVARAVFGENDPRWRLVRFWLYTEAPVALRDFYLKHGERLAKSVNDTTRALLYGPMNRIAQYIAQRYAIST